MGFREFSGDSLREGRRQCDHKELIQCLGDTGFVVIRHFLEPSLINAIRDDITATARGIFESFGEPFPPRENLDEPLVELVNRHPNARPLIYDRLQQVPSILALSNAAPIRKLSHEILDSRSIGVWPRVQTRLDSYLSEKEVIEWHNDYVYNRGTEKSFTFWIPLSDISFEMGPMKIASGSHKETFQFVGSANNRRHNLTLGPKEIQRLEIVQPSEYEAGDLVLMHSRTVHTGVVNTIKERARLVCLFRMQDLSALEIDKGCTT